MIRALKACPERSEGPRLGEGRRPQVAGKVAVHMILFDCARHCSGLCFRVDVS